MPAPLHVAAFEAFNTHIADHLEASISFALFLVSEREWAATRNPPPDEAAYQTFHQNYLTPHEIARYQQTARELLAEFGTTIVNAKRIEFLEDALADYRNAAASGHRGFRVRGVLEATLGALVWTILLIAFSIILARGGIDIFDYYQRAAGVPYSHPDPSKHD
jgi:hypothetical protein